MNFLSKFSKRPSATRTIGGEDRHLGTLIPGVADAEEDAGVVAGIVVAEAGVGVVDQVETKIDGALGPDEPMNATTELWSEVDAGGVGRRHIGGREQDATSKMEIRKDAAIRGEVPSHDEGFDARAIYCAAWSEDGVNGHDLDGVFKVSPQECVASEIACQDAAGATTGKEELRVRGFASPGAAAKERAEVPSAAAVDKGVRGLSGCRLLGADGCDERQAGREIERQDEWQGSDEKRSGQVCSPGNSVARAKMCRQFGGR